MQFREASVKLPLSVSEAYVYCVARAWDHGDDSTINGGGYWVVMRCRTTLAGTTQLFLGNSARWFDAPRLPSQFQSRATFCCHIILIILLSDYTDYKTEIVN